MSLCLFSNFLIFAAIAKANFSQKSANNLFCALSSSFMFLCPLTINTKHTYCDKYTAHYQECNLIVSKHNQFLSTLLYFRVQKYTFFTKPPNSPKTKF